MEKAEASSPVLEGGGAPDYGAVRTSDHPVDVDADNVSLDAQPGIQKIEATTQVWPFSHLVLAYVL
jgi:hypothetical protein